MNPTKGGWLIVLTMIGAMLLAVLDFRAGAPDWLTWLRPDWAIATLFFWALTTPARVGIFSAWCTGLFFDVLLGPSHTLGLHGACFAATVFIGTQFHERLRAYSIVQQTLVLGVIVLSVQVTKSLVRLLVADVDLSWLMPTTMLTTMLAYPLLLLALRPLADRLVQ